MKFRIEPEKQGQIARMPDVENDLVYIVIDISSKQDGDITVVELNDLQRHSQDISKVTNIRHSIRDLTVVADSLEVYVSSWNYVPPVPYNLKAYFIQNIEDVKQYFRDLHEIYESEFHPDDDFNDFTDENDKPTFTSEEATYLNMVMVQSFDICDKNGIEIYDVASEIQEEVWKRKGIWPNS